ncbi:MAG TPA: hypothetical protein VHX88_18045 [Solirubrobacteraceae bacterium]|jgi:4-diphosphocytidyl-2-C-methyl-D-erythritol kinase|nr:hypothetical protein [Solirubrobacteraceae bacterium]
MSDAWRALAPAKINLGLFLGSTREDGRHELVTVMQSVSLADELTLSEAPEAAGDEVRCPGVEGENLALAAIAAFRAATGWSGPPWRLDIDKQVPVAAGMGGGSGDAAAALRLCAAASGRGQEALLLELAAGLGADVPAQVRPGRVLARGAGERLERLPDGEPFGVLVLPSDEGLSTAAVYREADRLGLARPQAELDRLVEPLRTGLSVANDLQPAALGLRPELTRTLELALELGAEHALVSGSGPTVLGLFPGPGGPAAASAAARAAAGRGSEGPPARWAEPVGASGSEPRVGTVRHN